jgi:hypothetical protein
MARWSFVITNAVLRWVEGFMVDYVKPKNRLPLFLDAIEHFWQLTPEQTASLRAQWEAEKTAARAGKALARKAKPAPEPTPEPKPEPVTEISAPERAALERDGRLPKDRFNEFAKLEPEGRLPKDRFNEFAEWRNAIEMQADRFYYDHGAAAAVVYLVELALHLDAESLSRVIKNLEDQLELTEEEDAARVPAAPNS